MSNAVIVPLSVAAVVPVSVTVSAVTISIVPVSVSVIPVSVFVTIGASRKRTGLGDNLGDLLADGAVGDSGMA